MKVRIAVVQFQPKQFNPEHNLASATRFVREAAKAKAQLVVFPEDFVTGPLSGRKEFADEEGVYRTYFQQLAREEHIDIVAGSIVERHRGGALHNVCHYIDSKGRLRASYSKINLWLPERRYMEAGNTVHVVKRKFGKIGLAICWDLMFPEHFRKLATLGAEIVVCPSYWCKYDAGPGTRYDSSAEIRHVDALCVTRAAENCMAVVFCNAAGTFKLGRVRDPLIGHSQLTVPFKGPIKLLNHNRQEMFVASFDTKILKNCEIAYRIREDLKRRVF